MTICFAVGSDACGRLTCCAIVILAIVESLIRQCQRIVRHRVRFAFKIQAQKMKANQNANGRKKLKQIFDEKLLNFLFAYEILILFRTASQIVALIFVYQRVAEQWNGEQYQK